MLRRFVLSIGLLWCLLPTGLMGDDSAPRTLIIVRHAEKSAPDGDVPISEQGRARAQSLARMLRDSDLSSVYVTQMLRTRQTAAPAAEEKKLTPEVIPAADIPILVGKLKAIPAGRAALVVHHSNTISTILEKLGAAAGPPIGEQEYDRMLVVTLWPDRKPSVLTLRYHP